jgi:hypothetical protein
MESHGIRSSASAVLPNAFLLNVVAPSIESDKVKIFFLNDVDQKLEGK